MLAVLRYMGDVMTRKNAVSSNNIYIYIPAYGIDAPYMVLYGAHS